MLQSVLSLNSFESMIFAVNVFHVLETLEAEIVVDALFTCVPCAPDIRTVFSGQPRTTIYFANDFWDLLTM